MRIEARLDEDIVERVKRYQKVKGFTRDRAYGELIEKGLEAEGLIEMAKCGQATNIYEDDAKLRNLLATFLHTSHSCPMENILNTGIVHFMPVSMIRLWANGAFQELLKIWSGEDDV